MICNKPFHAHVCIAIIIMLIPTTVYAEGFTVLSVSYVKHNTHDANVTMELVIDGAGQSLSGMWSGSGLPANVTILQPLKIEVRNNTEKLIYPLINQNTLFKYHAYYVDSDDDNSAQCPAKPAFCYPVKVDSVYTWNHRIVSIMINRLIVVERQAIGSYSAFGNPDISQNIELFVSVGDKEYRQNIGTGQESRGSVVFKTENNDWLANARYTGMAMTGHGTPNQDLYVGTHENNKEWRISPKVYYDDYVKSLTETDIRLALWQDELPNDFNREGSYLPGGEIKSTACKDNLCSDVVNVVNLHNAEVDKLFLQNVRIDYGSPMVLQETVIRDGNIYDTLNQPIGYGHVVLTLSAEEIGIVENIGKPQIESISVSNYSSGDNSGILTIVVKNVGSNQGTFGVRINDSPEQKITLDPNAIGSVNLPIISIQEGLNYGDVQVYDIASGELDSKSYQINVSVPKKFIPNSSEVYNNAELKADNTGMTQNATMDCSNGLWRFDNGSYTCVLIEDIPEPVTPARMQYQIPIPIPTPAPAQDGGLSSIWIIMIGLLIGVIIGLLLTGARSKKGHVGIGLIFLILAISATVILAALYGDVLMTKINELKFMINIMEKLR